MFTVCLLRWWGRGEGVGKDSLTRNKQVYLHLMEKKVSPEKRTSKKNAALFYFAELSEIERH